MTGDLGVGRMLCKVGLPALVLTGALGYPVPLADAADFPAFAISDLGTLGGTESRAFGMNEQGDVVGWSRQTNGAKVAAIWVDGVISNLGSLVGTDSEAWDINGAGQVAGVMGPATSVFAFLYEGGSISNLGLLPGGTFSGAQGINEHGDLAAIGDIGADNHAFLWTNGVKIDLGTISGMQSSQAFDVNNRRQVVGQSHFGSPYDVTPMQWEDQNGNGTNDPGEMIPVTVFGGKNGVARGVNELLEIAGGQGINLLGTVRHAFIFSQSKSIDGGVLPGDNWAEFWDINDSGDAVGFSGTDMATDDAIIYFEGAMTNLNTLIPTNLGWHLNSARAINNAGQIAGYGTVSGETHAFRLTPLTTALVDIVTFLTADEAGLDAGVLAWRSLGSNLEFRVDSLGDLPSGAWTELPPTNQWPTTSRFVDLPDLTNAHVNFRVRANVISP